jgi:predicted permease
MVAQIAAAVVVTIGAGLLARSFSHLQAIDRGFDEANMAVMSLMLPASQYPDARARLAVYDELLRQLHAIPGIVSASPVHLRPGTGAVGLSAPMRFEGQTPEDARTNPWATWEPVTPSYFKTLGIPIVRGRAFTDADRRDSAPVVVVSESVAARYWPGQDPIGKYVLNACAPERRVIGVVGDVRHLALEQTSGNEMYIPMRQCGERPSADLVVRSTLPPAQLAGAIRAKLQPIAANLPGNDFRTLQQIVDKSVSPRRFVVLLLGGFALFALVLASLGIYGLISYSVSQRTQEIGIRMALGASARDVQARIVMQTLSLAAIGMVLGTIVAWLAVRSADSLLFGVTPRDPGTFAGMLVVLTCVALVAGYLPARRASRVDPMVALRTE